jgi:hypothetical protein
MTGGVTGREGAVAVAARQVLDLLEAAARARGGEGSYVRIDGRVAQAERAARVEAFQRDVTRRVALLGATAAGTGLTLTAASTVVFAELLWTPGHLLQARAPPPRAPRPPRARTPRARTLARTRTPAREGRRSGLASVLPSRPLRSAPLRSPPHPSPPVAFPTIRGCGMRPLRIDAP